MQLKSALIFKSFLESPGTVGEIFPTSLRTAHLMASFAKPEGRVLEIGAGTGAITRGIAERLAGTGHLTCVELNPELAAVLRKNFPDVEVRVEDAAVTLEANPGAYDAIISAVPFSVMSVERQTRYYSLAGKALAPDGVFVVIQYSLRSLAKLRELFEDVSVAYSFINLPPAAVYVCKRLRHSA